MYLKFKPIQNVMKKEIIKLEKVFIIINESPVLTSEQKIPALEALLPKINVLKFDYETETGFTKREKRWLLTPGGFKV